MLLPERLKQFSLHHPRLCGLTGVLSLAIAAIVIALIVYSLSIARDDQLSSVRWVCLLVLAVCYLAWLTLFLIGFLIVPKTKGDYLTYATSDKDVEQSLEVGRSNIRRTLQSDLENETDEVLASYHAKFKGLFLLTMLSYLSHVVTIIMFGAAFTFIVIRTTDQTRRLDGSGVKEVVVYSDGDVYRTPVNAASASAIKELDGTSPFVSHVYFSAMTILTIGFGYEHPLSTLRQWGVMIQCFSILLIVIFGLSYIVAFEQTRVENVRNAILADLRQVFLANQPNRQVGQEET